MKLGLIGLSTLMASVSLTVAMSACAPEKDRLPIKRAQANDGVQKVENCKNRLEIDSKARTIRGRSVKICIDSTEADKKKTEKPAYAASQSKVFYQIERDGDRIKIQLPVVVTFPEAFDEKHAADTIKFINQACLKDIKSVWKKANITLAVKLLTTDTLETLSLEEADEFPVLKIAEADGKAPEGAESDFLHLIMSNYPDRSDLFPAGHPECTKACADKKEKAAHEQCLQDCHREQSQPFCRSLAKATGHWLGLGEERTTATCELKDKALKSPNSAMMKGWTEATATSSAKKDNFWKDATLTSEDVAEVLAPACGSAVKDTSLGTGSKIDQLNGTSKTAPTGHQLTPVEEVE